MSWRPFLGSLSWRPFLGRQQWDGQLTTRGENMHSPSCTGPRRRGEEAVATASIKCGQGQPSPSLPAPTASLSAPPGPAGNVCVPRACPLVPVVPKLGEKALSLVHKNSEGWAGGMGLEGVCFAHRGRVGVGVFSVTEKIKQSAVQQRLLRLYPSSPPPAHSTWTSVSGLCKHSSVGRKAPWPRAVA